MDPFMNGLEEQLFIRKLKKDISHATKKLGLIQN